ncbi:flagellar motor stator protein MotA [Cognatishimia sp. F0-27]|uniref:flagellar motor stator protein MotA n=1 Tax=Cognatishimia sp. F0-27 TaxID=2816855 RepID=UPI001D0C44DC|nr:flagellar motor stator protein MotA [Cognatishimia sp. F0-27]MCC1492387.1 flagellar motor stator protein MotA [Cognatishimia sp. F0-27]
MLGIIGIATIFVMVFGGYTLAGGKFGIIIKALPFEMMMICGAALGAFLISNDGTTVKSAGRDIGKVFKGAKWRNNDYKDLLCLLYELLRIAKKSPVAIEEHIENPGSSEVFVRYPKILSDKYAIEIICDTLRSVSMNYDDPHQVEEILDKRIEALHHHSLHSSHALQSTADALPALGIVAAVLGVIKTMASIDQPPEVLGKLIGGALVGTFLGVFLAYGFVGPFANKVKAIAEEDMLFYKLIREVLIASLQNHTANICIEVGRQNMPSAIRPTFVELEDALRSIKQEVA